MKIEDILEKVSNSKKEEFEKLHVLTVLQAYGETRNKSLFGNIFAKLLANNLISCEIKGWLFKKEWFSISEKGKKLLEEENEQNRNLQKQIVTDIESNSVDKKDKEAVKLEIKRILKEKNIDYSDF